MTTQADTKAVERTQSMADPSRIIIQINGDMPVTWATKPGANSREIRLKPGANSVPAPIIRRLTEGGFDAQGIPKGGIIKAYFEREVPVTVFDARGKSSTRMLPWAQVIREVRTGEEVYLVDDISSVREHKSTRHRLRQERLLEEIMEEAKVAREQSQATQQAMLEFLKLLNPDIAAKTISASEADSAIEAAPAVDPSNLSTAELKDSLADLSLEELESVMLAEMRGKNRGTAIDAIRAAVDAIKTDDEDGEE